MKYWIFSILTALIAYFFGSLNTQVIASNFIFHSNLRRLGKGNAWLSNFRRIYGIKGLVKLALVELVKDALPVIIGGRLFASSGNAEVGSALAAFCLVLGRSFPSIYGFRGSYAAAPMIIGSMFVNFSIGAAVLVFCVLVSWGTRYLALGTIAGAVVLAVAGLLVIDSALAIRLCIFTAVLVIIRMVPCVSRIAAKKEERLNLKMDISYKFDEKI